MSLVIYIDKSEFKGREFINDVDSAFWVVKAEDTDSARKVISYIDKGCYLNNSEFIDRFGVKVYSKYLSTSSKAMLCLDSIHDKVIDFSEVGNSLGNIFLAKTDGMVIFR